MTDPFISDHVKKQTTLHNRPPFTIDHIHIDPFKTDHPSWQTTFTTDHVLNRPRSRQTTFTTDLVQNRPHSQTTLIAEHFH